MSEALEARVRELEAQLDIRTEFDAMREDRDHFQAAIERVIATLYAEGPDTQWDADTAVAIAEIVRPFRDPATQHHPEDTFIPATATCPRCDSKWIVEVGTTEYEQEIIGIAIHKGFREVADYGKRTDFIESDELKHYECKDCELVAETDLSAFVPGSELFERLRGERVLGLDEIAGMP